MTIVVLLFLAGIWGVVLYGYFRDRLADIRPADSIGSFRRQLSVLERTGPIGRQAARSRISEVEAAPIAVRQTVGGTLAPAVGRRPGQALRRRRDIVFGLLAAMGGSLVLGFLPALRVMWGLHVVLDMLFVGYVALLIRRRNLRAEREMKLRFLPGASLPSVPPMSSVSDALLLRRTGN